MFFKQTVLEKYFDPSKGHYSPVLPELARVVVIDDKGIEYVTYSPFDCQSVIKSNGKVSDWSLNNLLKAGVSLYSMPIHTSSFVSRSEGVHELEQISADLDSFVQSKNVD